MKLLFINLNKLKMYVLFYVLLLSKEAQSKKKKNAVPGNLFDLLLTWLKILPKV